MKRTIAIGLDYATPGTEQTWALDTASGWIKLTPSGSGASLLRRHHTLKLTLAVTYTPHRFEVVTLERARVPVSS